MAKPPILVAATLGDAARLELDTAIVIWRETLTKLEAAQEAEREARAAITDKYFKGCEEGSNTVALMSGARLVAEVRINRTVVPEQYQLCRSYALQSQNNDLTALLDSTFKQKPDLIIKSWKELGGNARKTLADIVTEKEGTPGLKYTEGS